MRGAGLTRASSLAGSQPHWGVNRAPGPQLPAPTWETASLEAGAWSGAAVVSISLSASQRHGRRVCCPPRCPSATTGCGEQRRHSLPLLQRMAGRGGRGQGVGPRWTLQHCHGGAASQASPVQRARQRVSGASPAPQHSALPYTPIITASILYKGFHAFHHCSLTLSGQLCR
jgi:hypothetical protein